MKKNLILLVSLVIITVMFLIWFKGEPLLTPVQKLEQSSMEATELDLASPYQTSEVQTLETAPPSFEHEAPEETIEQVPSNVCKEQLAEQYPELDRQYHQVIEGFYLSEEQMMGEGTYQNMPFETLKPLADSNDPQAMMVYGSDKIWHSATGIRISRSDSQYRTQEQTQEIVKNHRVDLVGINEGEDYLFRAAVFGKIGSIFEVSMLLDLTARQLDRKEYKDNLIEDVLVKSQAYKKLLSDIFKNDIALRDVFLSSDDPFKNIQRLYADREDYAEIRKQIESDAEKMYQELKARWEHDREYYGFEIYPDYLQGDLDEYGKAYLECHLR
ncbi:MAG TPA: hypothetical protein VIM93_04790 [Kangiella sp.]